MKRMHYKRVQQKECRKFCKRLMMACTDEKMMMKPAGCLDLPQTDVVRSRRLFSNASLKTTLKVPHERGVKQKG
jgi:hypothetical protein